MSDELPRADRWQLVRAYLCVLVAVVLMPLFGGKLVQLTLAALAAAVFTAVWWWFTDVGALTEAAEWTVESRARSRERGSDPRVSRLHRQIRDVLQDDTAVGSDVVLAKTLVDMIDQRVFARHGASVALDPGRYAAVIGPDLDAFVRAVAAGRATVSRRQLPALISRIERL